MSKQNKKTLKMVWIYKSAKNTTPEKFIIINEYINDGKTSIETGTVSWGMEKGEKRTVEYSGVEKSAEIVHKASMEALKKGFIVEKLEDGSNTYIADENALIEEDEEFFNGK